MNKSNKFLGRWRITHMDEWDQDYIDMVVPGFIQFDPDDLGEFQFGTVHGFLDTRIEQDGSVQRIEFSWAGKNDTDPGSGRGWALVEGGLLIGHLYIHLSDDSEFTAERTRGSI